MVAEASSGKPYIQEGQIRTFESDVDSKELVWHRDKQSRKVTVIEGQGWQLQYNGSLPVELIEGMSYNIPKMLYHRLIKGANKLIVKIEE